MREIILEKRYPHSREEDITDAFMRGYEIGKEQEHRWWSAFCANCKTENNSEKPNNSTISKMEQVDEPQTEAERLDEAWEMFKADKDEPQTDCSWK